MRFSAWASRHGLALSTAYVIAHRHAIQIRKIGRCSFVSSDDDARFVSEVLSGKAGTAARQDQNLCGKKKQQSAQTSAQN